MMYIVEFIDFWWLDDVSLNSVRLEKNIFGGVWVLVVEKNS